MVAAARGSLRTKSRQLRRGARSARVYTAQRVGGGGLAEPLVSAQTSSSRTAVWAQGSPPPWASWNEEGGLLSPPDC